MRTILRFAGAYKLSVGMLAVVFPRMLFEWAGMQPPTYPELFQCIGMIVGVYGIGYWVAASNPFTHWPIVLVGLLGKILGPAGFAFALARGTLPAAFGVTIITNDLIWWLPFAAILWGALKHHTEPRDEPDVINFTDHRTAMSSVRGDSGKTLAELSQDKPVLVVFLRHAGCTFHRQALADLRHAREQLANAGVQTAVVHRRRVKTRVSASRIWPLGGCPFQRSHVSVVSGVWPRAWHFRPAVWTTRLATWRGGIPARPPTWQADGRRPPNARCLSRQRRSSGEISIVIGRRVTDPTMSRSPAVLPSVSQALDGPGAPHVIDLFDIRRFCRLFDVC